jgi:hypothetical protein
MIERVRSPASSWSAGIARRTRPEDVQTGRRHTVALPWVTVSNELTPLPPPGLKWRVDVAAYATGFFSSNRDPEIAKEVGEHKMPLPGMPLPDRPMPWSVDQFIRWLKTKIDVPRLYEFEVDRLVAEMARVGVLYECGPEYLMAGVAGRSYWLTGSVRDAQRSGFLFLAEAIGPALIIDVYGALTVPIKGTDEYGDSRVGSGLVLDSTHILTNKHVVEDMTVDDEIPPPLTKPSVWDFWHLNRPGESGDFPI